MWPSRVGIKGYFVMYFDRIAVFEAPLYRWTSVEGRAHTGFVAVWLSNESTKRIWAPPLTEVQRYRASNTAFSPISCNECPPWSELHVANGVYLWSLRSTAISSMHIWGKKLHYTSLKVIAKQLCISNAVRSTTYTMLTVTWWRSECCAIRLDFEASGGFIVCYCLPV